jgi:hypothetical protein
MYQELFARNRPLQALVLAAHLPVLAAVIVCNPETTPGWPRCPTKAVLSIDCPGCGSSRALYALLHGRIGESIGFNPLVFVLSPLLVFGLASDCLFVVRGRGLPARRPRAAEVRAVILGFLAIAIARNLPRIWDLIRGGVG